MGGGIQLGKEQSVKRKITMPVAFIAWGFVVWGFCRLGLLSHGAFVVWGFYRMGLLSSGAFVSGAYVMPLSGIPPVRMVIAYPQHLKCIFI